MGLTGEHVSEVYKVSREDQDRYAADSHRKAAEATKQGWFRDEMLPVSIPQKKGDPLVVDRDESIREDTTAESLSRLKPAFKKDGTVTAGNAPGVNDGAAALVVMGADVAAKKGLKPIARIVGYATGPAQARDDDAGQPCGSCSRRPAGRSTPPTFSS
jgi:acetyl-CoA C-acetyltransferase